MKKFFSSIALALSLFVSVIFVPVIAFADHSDAHMIQQLQAQLASLQQAVASLLAAKPDEAPGQVKKRPIAPPPAPTLAPPSIQVTPPPPATYQAAPTPLPSPTPPQVEPSLSTPPSAVTPPAPVAGLATPATPDIAPYSIEEQTIIIEDVREKIRVLQDKVLQLRTTTQGERPGQPAPDVAVGLRLERTLRLGSSGDDVRQLQGFLKQFPDIYPEGLETGYFGARTDAAVRRFQEKHGIEPAGVVGPKTRAKLAELTAESKRPIRLETDEARVHPYRNVEIDEAVTRGSSGKNVEKVQEFLGMFPDIYPNGRASGFYGVETEQAVKKFQRKVGLKETGEIDEKTKEVLNLLLIAGEKKKPPKITDVTPSSGSVGITVTLTGKGFTDEENFIMVRGKIVATGLKSYDNNTQIDFLLTSDIPCPVGSQKACPVKVVNANGISNAKPFKLTEFLLIPPGVDTTSPPPPLPPPPPPPVPEPTVTPPPATPTITVVYPNGGELLTVNEAVKISWSTASIASRSVSVRLLKDGVLHTTLSGQFLLGTESGTFTFEWNVPASIQNQTGFTIEVADATDPAIKDASDGPFRVGYLNAAATWTEKWPPGVFQDNVSFYFLPSVYPTAASLRLYEKRPGDSAFQALVTFPIPSLPTCRSWSVGDWTLFFTCGYSDPLTKTLDTWSIGRNTNFPSSFYPVGTYEYYIAAVDAGGQETIIPPSGQTRAPLKILRKYAMPRMQVLSPADQALAPETPTFTWTLTNWPNGSLYDTYGMSVFVEGGGDMQRPYWKKYVYSVPTGATTTSVVYDGPAFDLTKKYITFVYTGRNIFNQDSLSLDVYGAMPVDATTFWTGAALSDKTPPTRFGGLPTGEQAYTTKEATLSLTTDETATCKYALTAGTSYSSMTLSFATTASTTHSSNVSGFETGKSYNYYVRCADVMGNANGDDFAISFGVASPPKPVITVLAPIKGIVGTVVTITGSGFTATGNSVSFAGAMAATNLASADGKTLTFTVPIGTSCKIGAACSVSVSNANGTSNAVSFLLIQTITPVTVIFPNGGENLVQGVDFTLSWIGGTDRVDVVLVEEAAAVGSDPGEFIVGWIATSSAPNSTVNWNVKTVCSADGTVCTTVSPGRYKIMALSEDELGALTIWNDVDNTPGNWDVSDRAFTISPSAALTVVVPNGGEIGSKNSAFIVCWATIDLKSKAVKIELLKNDAPYRTVYPSFAQSAETGAFITNWVIPDDIPEGADYKMKVSDVALPAQNDTSDGPFSIVAASSAIKVYEPYASSIWYAGFDGPVYYYGVNVPSKAVSINLWKGGFFYRSLASNVPQLYYGGTAYSTGWFWRKVAIPGDLPFGTDYTVEVVDAGNPSVRGFSGKFTVVQYPSRLTVRGRLFDYLTQVPLATTTIGTWDGSYNWYNNWTNANGEFNITATTSDILLSRGHSFWMHPTGHSYGSFYIYSNAYGLYAYIHFFPFINKGYITFPVSSGEIDMGEIPFWPVVDRSYVISDMPVKYGLNYRNAQTGQSTTNLWTGSQYRHTHDAWKAIPQALDVWVRLEDKPGNVYYSPLLNLPASPGVGSKTLSLFNQTPQWEPYSIDASASYSPQILKVGTPVSGAAYAWNGVAPYTWSMLAGNLPPGVTLSSTGALSGAPTEAGVYDTVFRARDSQQVNGVTRTNTYPYYVPNYSLRFDVRTTEGVQVAAIKVIDPQARVEMYPGSTYTVSWDSFGITGNSVVLDLYQAGRFVRKIAGFAQGAESGRYSYNWLVHQDLPAGNDYYIRISDVNNPAVYGESDAFLILGKQNASWSENSGAKYSPSLSFQYATSSNPGALTFRLYRQNPGETSLTLVGTFASPACYQSISSGKWYLYLSCSSWYPNPQWSLQYSTYVPASEFPAGEYRYEFRAADSAGGEVVLARWMLRALEPTSITYPTAADAPISSSGAPTIRWTIPKDWPPMLEKPYRVVIQEAYTGKQVHQMWGLSAPTDTVGFRTYDGPTLDPTKKYTAHASYRRGVVDSTSAQRTEHMAMSAGTATFWFDQYVPPPPVSISTESLPAAMIWTSYAATLAAAGGLAPYKWSLISGALPQGFYVDSSGRIYGWTSQQGIFKFTVGVTDYLGGAATKELSIEVKPDTGAYWSGGSGSSPTYSQYVRFGYANGKPADVTSFKLYQKKPGDAAFSAAGMFTGVAETCGVNYSPADSLWSLYFNCGTTYRYWQSSLKVASTSSAFPVGEYDYYVAAIGGDGAESAITPILKQFALERTTILSPTEAQSPVASTTLAFEWTVALSGWPSGVSQMPFLVYVMPEGSYSYVYYKWVYSRVGAPTAATTYNGPELDSTKKYVANVAVNTTVFDSVAFAKVSYIAMMDATPRFWITK